MTCIRCNHSTAKRFGTYGKRRAWYNFCRVHATLRVTPAMEAGLTNHVWNIAELLGVA